MSGINKVILVGNLGKDPEVRHLEGGAVVAKFPLATDVANAEIDSLFTLMSPALIMEYD